MISFVLQLLSLLPICCIVLLTSRLKCFMCGGGGGCATRSGGSCDCMMSFMAVVILFLIFRATGLLDKLFFKLGYAKSAQGRPTGGVTQCSRNDTEYYDDEKTVKGDLRQFGEDIYDQTDQQYFDDETVEFSTMLLSTDASKYTETDISYKTINDDVKDNSTKTTVQLSLVAEINTAIQNQGNYTSHVTNPTNDATDEPTSAVDKILSFSSMPGKSPKDEFSKSSNKGVSESSRQGVTESAKKGDFQSLSTEVTTILYYLVA